MGRALAETGWSVPNFGQVSSVTAGFRSLGDDYVCTCIHRMFCIAQGLDLTNQENICRPDITREWSRIAE